MVKGVEKIRKFVFPVFVVIALGYFLVAGTIFAAKPGAPTITSVVAGDGKATISFAPTSNGGKTITGYTVTASPAANVKGTSSPIVVSGLTNGTAYTFTITSTNDDGTSSSSVVSAKVIPKAGGTATSTDPTVSQTANTNEGVAVGVSYPNGTSDNAIQSGQKYTYVKYVDQLYGFAMKAAIALSVLMLIFAGYKYLTSRGESGAINEAKDILFSTLMGAALLMLVILVGNVAGLNVSVWGI